MGLCFSKKNLVLPFEPQPLETISENKVLEYRTKPSSPIRVGIKGLKKLRNN